jgi:hypothetical protein
MTRAATVISEALVEKGGALKEEYLWKGFEHEINLRPKAKPRRYMDTTNEPNVSFDDPNSCITSGTPGANIVEATGLCTYRRISTCSA